MTSAIDEILFGDRRAGAAPGVYGNSEHDKRSIVPHPDRGGLIVQVFSYNAAFLTTFAAFIIALVLATGLKSKGRIPLLQHNEEL